MIPRNSFFFVDACPSSSLIRLIVNCFFTSLLYLFPNLFAVLSLCGIALDSAVLSCLQSGSNLHRNEHLTASASTRPPTPSVHDEAVLPPTVCGWKCSSATLRCACRQLRLPFGLRRCSTAPSIFPSRIAIQHHRSCTPSEFQSARGSFPPSASCPCDRGGHHS